MKKIFVLSLTFLMSFGVFAQGSKVQTAWSNLDYYRQDRSNIEELVKAKEAIDLACEHEKTKGSAKTWFYKGQIYSELANTENKDLSNGAADASYASFEKVIELEKASGKRAKYSKDALNQLKLLSPGLYNDGYAKFQNKDYKGAYGLFSKVLALNELDMENAKKGTVAIDTSTMVAAAYSADKGGLKDEAKILYGKLIDMKYEDPAIYQSLAKIHRDGGDAAKADAILEQGREAFPDNSALIIDEINRLFAEGKKDEAMAKVEKALELTPDNASLYAALGGSYLDKQDYPNAEKMFAKAVELDDDFADAYYNLGVVYYNQGADISKQANELPFGDPEYDKLNGQAEDLLKKALPQFERFLELDPSNVSTMNILKETYLRLKMNDKFEAINAKLKAAQGK